jgi:cytochrome c5|tara:strand:+ start:491 stop:805 length:315 start_codon:yes stop_codon:yes gene_type:complete
MFLNLARDLLIFSFVLLACLPINIFSKSAQEIYDDGCAVCHDSGLAGAPMMGNKGQWEARQAKGYEMLVNNAYNGINGMPAKGLCADCTKEEIGIAVQYMLDTI